MDTVPTIIAIGNGPSLREVDLPSLRGVHTLGMNAAYRHWQKIDWWPTYYACADHRFAMSHIPFFVEAAKEGRFRAMLLPASVLVQAPELAAFDTVTFVDQFLPYWFDRLDRRFGRRLMRDPFFDTQRPASMTTGAMSLRWALSLGYRRIGLLGIDCTYLPMKEWARDDETPIALRIGQPVASNPNYFFDDYQRVGDLFNVPSPETHSGNLHLEAIASVRDDLAAIDSEASLEVLSERSALCSSGVLAYTPLAEFLDRGRISLLLIDARTADGAEAVTAALDAIDDPARAPALHTRLEDRSLVVLTGHDAAPGTREAIERFFEGSFLLRRIFRSIEVQAGGDPASLLARVGRPLSGLALSLPLGARPLRPRWLEAIERRDAVEPGARLPAGSPFLTDLGAILGGPDAVAAASRACPGAIAAEGDTDATAIRMRAPDALIAHGLAPGDEWIDDEGSPLRIRLQSDGLTLTEIRSEASGDDLTLDPVKGGGLSFHVARLDRAPFYPEERLELKLATASGRLLVSLMLLSSEKLPVSGRAFVTLAAGESARARLEIRSVTQTAIVALTPMDDSGPPARLDALDAALLMRDDTCIARARASRPRAGRLR